ncbi:helix-turn-helix domain-containing protein [Marinicrinis sediminis]|uniref:Helix-turn-helix domain-containing protein n=1 Tax=Marinicrinis sediminis TaxID=1652465 RepID=A0ABW5R6K1_9BACL
MPTIHELAKQNRHHIGKGVRISRFRRPNSWNVQNRVLMSVLIVENIKLSELAKKIGVSPRTVAAWVYEGRMPSEDNQRKVAELLGLPEHIVFAEQQGNPEIEIPEESKFMFRVIKNSPVHNRILAGLLAVHDVSATDVCRWIEISPATLRKYIHQGANPHPEILKKLSDFFQFPQFLLSIETAANQMDSLKEAEGQ